MKSYTSLEKCTSDCEHSDVKPNWDYVTCTQCGHIKTGNHADAWGIAKGQWFKNVEEAKFYKQHGRIPEDR